MKYSFKKRFTTPRIYWIIIIISVLIGLIIRLKGLGKWPLALDEYYIVKSAENILKHGLPLFPNGGYYSRGIVLQYLIALLISIGVKAEFASRIFSVIANLVTIPPLYLITKRVGNQLTATVIVVIFSLSIWEIEFARFARMYAPFQAIFMWYIYFALIDYKNKNFINYKWMLFLSSFSIFIYEGSFFLAVFNFVPFILLKKIKLKYLIWTVIVFVFSAFFNTFDFRTLNCAPTLPPEFSEIMKASMNQPPIKIPKILFPFAFGNIVSIILTSVLIVTNVFLSYRIIKFLRQKNFWSIFSVIFLTVLALINQFGFFFIILILLVFWKLFDLKSSNKKLLINLSLIFFIDLIFWFTFGILSKDWYVLFNDFSSYSLWGISKRLLIGFFNYPDNYFSLLNYYRTLPLLTVFSTISILSLFFILFVKGDKFECARFLIGSLIFMSLLTTIPTLAYEETRYTFFLVPVLLILVIYSSFQLTNLFIKKESIKQIILVFLILGVFVLSKDFNAYHLLNVDKAEVNYRMIYRNNLFKKHLYRRWDILTPTNFVKSHLDKDDLIMINENSHEYYLPRVDYFNFNYRHKAFPLISVEYGQKERWSNAKLIYTNKGLINFIENRTKTVWFTVYPENWLFDIDFYKKYKKYQVYEGIDGMIKVFKFPNRNLSWKLN